MNISKLAKTGAAALVAAVISVPAWSAAPEYTLDLQTNPGAPRGGSTVPDCNDPLNPLTNCGFESGDFTGWGTEDIANPFLALGVSGAGNDIGFGFFLTAPTEGTQSLQHGFDGSGDNGGTGATGGGTISVWQEVSLPAGATELQFDYRGAWDMTFGANLDRTFRVDVEPMGGGAALMTQTVLTATAGDTVTDTGILPGIVDVSAFSGSDVRLSFEWDIPEDNTGPGFFEVDNVSVGVSAPALTEVPTLSTWGVGGMVGLIAMASLWLMVRRNG